MPLAPLPAFRYHPDPLRTGTIVPSDTICRCCERSRAYIYTGPVYAADDLESAFCPWCISDGTAAERFDAEFVDCHALEQAGIDDAVIAEISRRTPGFVSWQAERWLTHCDDACEFHGDLPRERLETLSNDTRAAILACLSFDMTWERVVADYEPGGQPAIYWFRCRHCSADLYYADYH